MLKPVRTVAPAVTPVSVAEARDHCRVDTNDEDVLISALVDTAVSHLDGHSGVLGRAMVTQTWRQDYPRFVNRMRLPLGDLITVSSVTYYDADNAVQTLSTDIYTAFSDSVGPYLDLKPDQSWPSTYTREDAVRVTWTAGYGPAATDVPAAIRQAMLLMIGHWFENREASVVGVSVTDLPMAVNALLAPYSLRRM